MGTHADSNLFLIIAGWAFADSVLYRLAPLWIGARGLEFTWEYIFQGLEANANLKPAQYERVINSSEENFIILTVRLHCTRGFFGSFVLVRLRFGKQLWRDRSGGRVSFATVAGGFSRAAGVD
ncbi:hypothetical protein MA16_Dca020352 [Dendrobium catenatum]|uniref:BOS complex subunit TMEM147 n=1 Tax=Dendrobium catenatum TaxID=906689 RepID=A0A2I0VMV8_9ASPA|nr:hypothetical protein MA16_Dca020352 [Dendrobium catenatum]